MPVDANLFCQPWVHSHEEDSAAGRVFRPADFPFPPSRGRKAFHPRPDGTLAGATPGADDRPRRSAGSWHADGDQIRLEQDGQREVWTLVALAADRLVITRAPS